MGWWGYAQSDPRLVGITVGVIVLAAIKNVGRACEPITVERRMWGRD